MLKTSCVATLALGSRPMQGLARARAQKPMSVGECELTFPNELSLCLGVESQWISKTSENDCKGQNPSPWGILYTIGKLLKRRCPKWARMTHLDIWNTSYDQKKNRELNWQFDSRPREVENLPDPIVCRWRVWHIIENLSTRATTSI
jgi:hypothetical protein